MTNIYELSTEQLENMAWDTNLSLREHLIEMRFNPPLDGVNIEKLQTETSTLMRSLDEYQSCLYLRTLGAKQDTTTYFDQKQDKKILSKKLEDYYNWRLNQLGKPGVSASNSSPIVERARNLEDSEPKRYDKLFEKNLYDKQAYRNHWHMVMEYDSNGEQFIDFGNSHQDIGFVDIIASYKNGFSINFYSGSEIMHNGQTLTQGISSGLLLEPIKGTQIGHPQPHITVSGTGSVGFNL
ncbi:hypothetical protein HZC27_05470 [Candidatus Roizmanbacteria bacterium]|nr:hypothetical protein [Candidatus Roizmanbacteria bacterium]